MEAAAWGLLGTIAGAAASIGTTILASRNAVNLQRAAARSEQLDKHKAFQRETLIELQEVLHGEWRAVSLAYHADEAAFRNTGKWGEQLLGEELNSQAHQSGRRRFFVTERVADDKLRAHIKQVSALFTEVLLARDQRTAQAVFHELATEGNSVMEHIGTVLRSLYADSGA